MITAFTGCAVPLNKPTGTAATFNALPANPIGLPGFVKEVLRILTLQVTSEKYRHIPVHVISQGVTGTVSRRTDIAALDPLMAGLGDYTRAEQAWRAKETQKETPHRPRLTIGAAGKTYSAPTRRC
jgi:hypothetical protein